MEIYYYLFGLTLVLKVLNAGRFIRLLFFRIAYPNATLKQIENFEKNTSPRLTIWSKKNRNEEKQTP
jgi:hypothetical protein